jgi:hypothetical protein
MLDLIEHIAAAAGGTPVMLLHARPDLLERRSRLGRGRLDATNIALDVLTAAESEELIANLVRGAPLPADVVTGSWRSLPGTRSTSRSTSPR